ncbi:MAG TPA: 2-C-methyl-D-erythritol 2,4-cyclodiphosphate synthase [Planctomycetota bacterium]
MSDAFETFPRIGLGWDLHHMQAGRPCLLAGLRLECPVGPAGHSDGDAVLHAITDAVLGAAGLPDLGTLFPDTDPQWQDASSERFLHAALERAAGLGLRIVSADVVLVCDRPKVAPHRDALRKQLARQLDLPLDRVNLKGKTTEGTRTEECIEATAVVLMMLVPRAGPS